MESKITLIGLKNVHISEKSYIKTKTHPMNKTVLELSDVLQTCNGKCFLKTHALVRKRAFKSMLYVKRKALKTTKIFLS